MISVYPANSRYTADHGWLLSNFSYSFADYYDPNNMQFGAMRVLNDDFIAPLEGFGMHPHREMEIVSVVLSGELQHKDSQGNTAVTSFGEIQRMSAGTGIYHSEYNISETEKLNLLQMWFLPEEAGLKPSYETTNFDVAKMRNALLPIVSKHSGEDIAHIHQNMTIYLSDLDTDQSLQFTQEAGRKIFLFVIEGELTLNGESQLSKRDSARITDVHELQITSGADTRFMLIDLA